MKVLLAGRVSEQITFGRVTTGASDDLKRVTAIARSMVYEYGMGTVIRSHQVPSDDYTVSESLRQTRDEEVQEIAEEAYRGAHRLLTDHRDLLDEIAERLLDERGDRARRDPDDHGPPPRRRRLATAVGHRSDPARRGAAGRIAQPAEALASRATGARLD